MNEGFSASPSGWYHSVEADFRPGAAEAVAIEEELKNMGTANLPVHYLPLILPVDWFLDRFRTATNTFGDSVGSAVVDQTFPKDEAAVVAA